MTSAPNVLLVFPRFNPDSFWSLTEACTITGKKAPAPPLGLITLAALLPSDWQCTLINCNTQTLTDADIRKADLVMTGGMLPQRPDALRIIARCRALGTPVCIGGPDATSSPDVFAASDFRVLGEAEGIIDAFCAAWMRGDRSGRFDAEKFQADVTKSPVPRFGLLDFSHYLFVGVQFSRGCPFNCEFCDIIELYGRVPRTKTNAQMLAELDCLHALGYRGHVDFVDDNLIGNKKALKRFLPELQAWQRAHGYPFKFSTEASINLSDDAELLVMLRDANFFAVFVGIESGDTETLVSMQKKQNTRRSLEESVFRIYAAGIYVIAGFIVGFDTEKAGVAVAMARTIQATSIPVCIVGLLTALPNTQLTRRLEREKRLFDGWAEFDDDQADQCTAGLNFTTLRDRREVLEDYRAVLAEIYTPKAFFARLTRVATTLQRPDFGLPGSPEKTREDLRTLRRMVVRLCLRRPAMAPDFVRLLLFCFKTNPRALESVMTQVMIYMHVGPFAHRVIRSLDGQIRACRKGSHATELKIRATRVRVIEPAVEAA